ncbi:spherulin-1A protein [Rhizoctonia solani]|uniref:Spherulin-1A protein n=1 Tax=Rhizoctonia solani TaxID=456999 RepID=A0A8H8P750_9AGAM|nr:spherulin-1A protein [Rhizoctonia solani]QRW25028.1 spherulin-1A protein [Rhizoctonia solani]
MRMSLALALALSTGVLGAPAPAADTKPSATKDSSTTIFSSKSAGPSPTTDSLYPSPTVPYASEDLNESYLDKFQNELPEPIRGSRGANILGPQNVELDRQNPDILAPPTTDSGSVENVKWPFSLSHNRIQDGGWARQQNVHSMPIATTIAGVNMRLKAGTMRLGIPYPQGSLEPELQGQCLSFDHIPDRELYMIPLRYRRVLPKKKGSTPRSSGWNSQVVDSRTFKVSKTIALAEVTVEVGGMRELHWHPTQPECEGNARITVFAAEGNARTFNYQPGDIGYVPPSFGHYVENIGNTTLKLLEIFNSDKYEDISLNQWLALTPPDMVKAHLQLSDDTISKLQK